MEKKAIYPADTWLVTETDYKLENNYRNETTFALSNGYIGTRGTYEEGYDYSVEEGLEGNFINGFYESEDIRYGEWNFGFPTKSQSLLNLPNAKTVKIILDGEEMDMRKGCMEQYSRSLDMLHARLVRTFIWTFENGKKIQIEFRRFVSLVHKNRMLQLIKVTPLNFSGKIQFQSFLDGAVENHTRKTNPLVDYGPFGKRLHCDKMEAEEDLLYYEGKTKNSGLSMACGCRHKLNGSKVCFYSKADADSGVVTLEADAEKNKTMIFEKYIAYTSDLDMSGKDMESFIKDELEKAKEAGYSHQEEEQNLYMEQYWEGANVDMEGEDDLLQGIRFNLFHIMQAAGRDGKTGLGAKGLSGEGYEGHYFWDTEMYAIPVFVYTSPDLAKKLLDYRFSTLNQARDRARVLGHQKGALYPWRTINGEEASTYFPLGTAQYHINADIAYAFSLYVEVTGDYEYLKEKAAEVLCETARVWADVGCFAECKGGKYCICAVTGPDEYNAIVDNNFYTNLMARENIRDALHALQTIKENDADVYAALFEKLDLQQTELEYWQKIVDNMYFPFDENRKVYPLDDGFMMRKPWDDTKIPEEKRHLLYENYHPLFIYRQRMSKQADAILGMYLHSNLFTKEELKRNYDFYQEVTLHHSSLSTCIFGILASEIGYEKEAYNYFSQSARMDLDDYHNNFYAGIHAANMAGTWLAIVNGFSGLRTNAGKLEFHPTLPEEWKAYSFTINYRGSRLNVRIEPSGITIELKNNADVKFEIEGKTFELHKKGDSIREKI